ncbi:putative copper resistance protein D [Compostimonas suwonensis]|uniref:Putative copper resistance protein D n=2 Tax=Compostimonas suwonensis TaxID=1048394 RepID=A0A2M9C479_9MICO|nr:cytochrome c oxidase assembly protein [Compostimonas suwonensis]PJJ65340.1 putative copper resistance protein D [Compostimonas suwonensis]
MRRPLIIVGPAVLLAVAIVSMVLALSYGGAADPLALRDAGPVVRWGLPAAKLMVNLGAAGTIGALVLVCFALTPKKPEFNKALDIAAGSAAVLTVAAAGTGFFTFLKVTGSSFSTDPAFGDKLSFFITTVEVGQAWLTTTLIAAAVTVLCFAVRNQTALVFVAILSVIALVPMAQQGHAAGTSGHDAAITALGLHLVFAAVWLGGLLTIVLLRKELAGGRILPVITRYSTLALVCFLVVAVSGYAGAELRIGSLDRLLTPYGILVLVKVFALVALGFFGAIQRRYLIGRMSRSAKPVGGHFWWLVAAELGFMGLASGVAAALAQTATPVEEVLPSIPTPAEILTGEPLPPELTPLSYFTEWNFDLIWLLICAFGIFFYLAGVRRLRRRGDSWPLHRTILWVVGMVALFYVTNGAVNVYEKYLFSTHMLGHMALTMMVPVLLVPGAPITLALRAIVKRDDGSRGPREWIMLVVHSKVATVLTNPIVAAVLFAGSLWVFYYSPVFSWATTDHIGHEWMITHFLITGYLFVQSLIGVDPVPYRLPYPFRLVLLLGTMAFHAFFGLALMTGSGLLLADWYGAMGRSWGVDALADQQAGGGIAWSIGEIPTVVLAIIVAIQWGRSDDRETKRRDRNADRTNEAELEEYNDRLARLAAKDR